MEGDLKSLIIILKCLIIITERERGNEEEYEM